MNTTIKKAVLTLAAAGSLTFAQAQKIAHLSFDSLINMMPETKIATDAAKVFLDGLEKESIAMQTELETKYKDYMDKQPTMSDILKRNREEEIQSLQRRIEDFRQQGNQEYIHHSTPDHQLPPRHSHIKHGTSLLDISPAWSHVCNSGAIK